MSFFGFDTSMPPGLGPGGDSLDERLRKMAEADENLCVQLDLSRVWSSADDLVLNNTPYNRAVYDWEAGGLDEALDEFNDDTFGLGGDVGGSDGTLVMEDIFRHSWNTSLNSARRQGLRLCRHDLCLSGIGTGIVQRDGHCSARASSSSSTCRKKELPIPPDHRQSVALRLAQL